MDIAREQARSDAPNRIRPLVIVIGSAQRLITIRADLVSAYNFICFHLLKLMAQ